LSVLIRFTFSAYPATFVIFCLPSDLCYLLLTQRPLLSSAYPVAFVIFCLPSGLCYLLLTQRPLLSFAYPATFVIFCLPSGLYYLLLTEWPLLSSAYPVAFVILCLPSGLCYLLLTQRPLLSSNVSYHLSSGYSDELVFHSFVFAGSKWCIYTYGRFCVHVSTSCIAQRYITYYTWSMFCFKWDPL